jgi:hypothetical protein
MKIVAAALLGGLALHAAELKPQTLGAFERYIGSAAQRLDARQSFLWCAESADRLARARRGELVVEPTGTRPEAKVADGLIHDWVGCVFIPGTTLDRTLALVQDYDHHKAIYQPELVDSKILRRNGGDFLVFMRLLKKKVITVVLDTETAVHYTPVDRTRAKSRSSTTSIAEVENAGKADERKLPPGTGHGFLWRLDTFWRFEERDGGVYVECQALSLTRDVPTGLGWIIEPIIRNLPRESLANTLRSTRSALDKSAH